MKNNDYKENENYKSQENKLIDLKKKTFDLRKIIYETNRKTFHFLRDYQQSYFSMNAHEIQLLNSNSITNVNSENKNNLKIYSKEQVQEKFNRPLPLFRNVRSLKGHGSKVYCVDWNDNNNELVSTSHDAKLLVWNTNNGFKKYGLNLDTEFTIDCKYSPDCRYIACGGLDDTCSIYSVDPSSYGFEQSIKPLKKLQHHTGYISCIRWIDNETILTSSGDKTLILWDVPKEQLISVYLGHHGDVMSTSINPTNRNIFVSGGVDYTCRIWDRRLIQNYTMNDDHNHNTNSSSQQQESQQQKQPSQSSSVFQTSTTHVFNMGTNTDVNCVQWFPDGNAFAAGCDDGVIRLYDIRSLQQINEYNYSYNTNSIENTNNNEIDNLSHNGKPLLSDKNEEKTENKNDNETTNDDNDMNDDYLNSDESDLMERGNIGGVSYFEFSKSGQFIFATYNDKRDVLVWNTINGNIAQNIQGHLDHCPKVALSKDGSRLAICSWDRHIRIYTR